MNNHDEVFIKKVNLLMGKTSTEFVSFLMQQIGSKNIVPFVEFDRKKLYRDYNNPNVKMQTFTKWLSAFCQIFNVPKKYKTSCSDRYTLLGKKIESVYERYQGVFIKKDYLDAI